jgi:predicted RNA-binding Zn-ribbon protein involved in translation (DUF1610 family)
MMMSTIKSRPTYDGLRAMPRARRNLVAVEGEGAAALSRLMAAAPEGFAARTHVLYVDAGQPSVLPALRRLHTDRLEVFADVDGLLGALDALLTDATMGLQLYVAGTEGLVGRVVRLGIEHGIDHKSVLTEHVGSLARRVQCVHCKLTAERVTTSVYECAGCGNLLFVRDHYSRRLAAFQGVCVNAEDPTERPAAQDLYA